MKAAKYFVALFVILDHGNSPAQEGAADLMPDLSQTRLAELDDWWEDPSRPVPFAAAKAMWRMSRLSDSLLKSRVSEADETMNRFDVVEIEGEAIRAQKVGIPNSIAESLAFNAMWLVRVQTEAGHVSVLSKTVPDSWSNSENLPQPVRLISIMMSGAGKEPLLINKEMQWHPTKTDPARGVLRGWTLLSGAGFNANRFGMIQRRNRSALAAEESATFYEFMRAASQVPASVLVNPKSIQPQDLLQSNKPIGEYVHLKLETARVQRIYDISLRDQIGQDHYWEIDAFGDLGNLRVRVEAKEGNEPIEFGYRYPVTLTMLELPPFLKSLVEENGEISKVMLMHQAPIHVEGFFYRLWSYDTDFVSSRGGERQIGPLIFATQIRELDVSSPSASVNVIGWVGATVFLLGLLLTVIYLLRNSASDRQMKQARSATLPKELVFDEAQADES